MELTANCRVGDRFRIQVKSGEGARRDARQPASVFL